MGDFATEGWGTAWVLLCRAVAVHIMDEALHGFLPLYNRTVHMIRTKVPWLPLPTFTFQLWLAGLIGAVLCAFALTPFAFRDSNWLRPVAVLAGVAMLGNALLHLGASAYLRKPVPGVYSSPFLLAASLYLLLSIRSHTLG